MGLDPGSTWRTCSPGADSDAVSRESHIGKYLLNCFGLLARPNGGPGFPATVGGPRLATLARPPNYSGPVLGRGSGDGRLSADDGSADPDAAAALAAFAAGAGSEHAALTALASTRLLVPVLAAPAQDSGGLVSGDGPADHAASGHAAAGHGAAGTGTEKTSEMSIPALVGQDGRLAVPAFTCLDALTRWRPEARPVPMDAGRVWQSAVADARAVVLDVAGPVPVAIDGARLAALASGQPVPLPHDDPDVLAEVTQAVAGLPAIGATRLSAGGADGDLTVELVISPGCAGPAAELARSAATAIMARLGTRLRRGVQVVIRSPRE